MSLVFKVPILLLQHGFVLIEEAPKVLHLGVLQHLEPLERLRDLLRCRDLGHLCDRLAEQVILTLNQSFVVPQEVLQLLHTRDVRILVASLVHIVRAPVSVEQLERPDFLVDRLHEVFESAEVGLKLLDQVLAILVESSVEQLIADGLNLALDFGLGLWVLVELGTEALRVDVVL